MKSIIAQRANEQAREAVYKSEKTAQAENGVPAEFAFEGRDNLSNDCS
jgi:hypothetical protein